MLEAAFRRVTHHQASQLLHNKCVVVLGGSVHRSLYKDLVLFLQRDSLLSQCQLRSKGEPSFEQDCLIEGGRLGHMTNGTEYREVRQYRTDHHLVRFYFITRIFSKYMESILADFENDVKPDVVIVNSCIWDVSRYNRKWVSEYRENLNKFFARLKAILPKECLVVWNMAMPLGQKIIGGFLVPEIEHMGPTLRYDVIEANFYSAMLADAYDLDVLDLHFLFRFSLHHRMKDGIHWNAIVHRQITFLLLAHAAQAWGVVLSSPTITEPLWYHPPQYNGFSPCFYVDSIPNVSQFHNGFISFEQNNTTNNGGNNTSTPASAVPSCSRNNLVMMTRHIRQQYNPYSRNPNFYYSY